MHKRMLVGLSVVLVAVAVAIFLREPTPDHRSISSLTSKAPDFRVRTADGDELALYSGSHALVIGVSNYQSGWRSLPGVATDVDSIKSVLLAHGFSVDVVRDPGRDELYAAFEHFIAKYGHSQHARLLFYFAGHGYTMPLAFGRELGYIVPANAPDPRRDRADFAAKAMDMEQIGVYAKRAEAKHVLFVFDACFSGTVFSVPRSQPPANISYKTSEPVRQFISSGSADEQVPDESVFRDQFCAAVGGAADRNADGYVTGSELGEFLQETVINYTNGNQHPQYGKLRERNLDKGDFVFRTSASASDSPPTMRRDFPRTAWGGASHSTAEFRQVTFTGNARTPRVSPDGDFLAYVAENDSGGHSVFVQDMKGGRSLEVFRADRVDGLRWSPDGAHLVFSDNKEVTRLIPRLGGAPQLFQYWPVVGLSPDGRWFTGAYNGEKEIFLVNAEHGERRSVVLTGEFQWLLGFQWSPIGDRIAVLTSDVRETAAIWTVDVHGGQTMVKVTESRDITSMAWGPKGRSIYFLLRRGRSSELWKVPIEPATGTPGSSLRLLSGLRGEGPITVSRDGTQMSFLGTAGHSNLWRLDLAAPEGTNRTTRLTVGTHFDVDPRISPDGQRVAFSRYAGPVANIYTIPIDGGPPTQKTFLETRNSSPVWSPDGQTIAFASDEDERIRVWRVPADVGPARPFERTVLAVERGLSWAPGDRILYQRPGNQNFHVLDPVREKETPLLKDFWAGWSFDPLVSPDRKRFAIERNHFEAGGIWVVSLEDSAQHPILLSRASVPLRWSDDGRKLYARVRDGIVRVPTRKRFRGLPFIGINVENIDEERRRQLRLSDDEGVVVTRVNPRGLASHEGLRVDDVIRVLDGHVIRDESDIRRVLPSLPLRQRVAVTLLRGGESLQVEVTVQERFWSLMRSPDDELEFISDLPFDRVTAVSMGPDTTKVVCAVEESFTDGWVIENFDPELPTP